jgi:hypothetical protein
MATLASTIAVLLGSSPCLAENPAADRAEDLLNGSELSFDLSPRFGGDSTVLVNPR